MCIYIYIYINIYVYINLCPNRIQCEIPSCNPTKPIEGAWKTSRIATLKRSENVQNDRNLEFPKSELIHPPSERAS